MEKTKLTETFYEFTIDNQWRIMLSEELREVYGFEKDIVYCKLIIIDNTEYLKIAGKKFEFFHATLKLDSKSRCIVLKTIREKIGLEKGSVLTGFEIEEDMENRYLLLKKK